MGMVTAACPSTGRRPNVLTHHTAYYAGLFSQIYGEFKIFVGGRIPDSRTTLGAGLGQAGTPARCMVSEVSARAAKEGTATSSEMPRWCP
eukprot:scaffold911_cov361-Prasinococcus_capsulatus_cf.AAC.19